MRQAGPQPPTSEPARCILMRESYATAPALGHHRACTVRRCLAARLDANPMATWPMSTWIVSPKVYESKFEHKPDHLFGTHPDSSYELDGIRIMPRLHSLRKPPVLTSFRTISVGRRFLSVRISSPAAVSDRDKYTMAPAKEP